MSGTCPGSTPNSPSNPGAVISSTFVSTMAPRGVVTDSRMTLAPSFSGVLLGELFGAGAHVVQAPLHVEGLLGQVVALALDDLLEAGDGVLDLDVLAWRAREGLGHEERLGKELLDLAGARHCDLVVLGELVHPEDSDDVLKLLVLLQDLLNGARHRVVLLADHRGGEGRGRRLR